jgi:flagellar biosynthetic protein FlhB
MAGYADDKTEPPTPRRRQQTREQGQVARSQDLSAAALLLTSFVALGLLGPSLWQSLLAITRAGLGTDSAVRLDDVMPFAGAVATETIRRLFPFLAIIFVVIVASVLAQVGLLLTWKPLIPSLGKISPIGGFKRLFSIRSIMTAVASFGKLLVVGVVAYLTLMGSAAGVVHAVVFGFPEVFSMSSSFVFRLGMRLGVALIILALLDFVWQRYRHERDMRMTKEEVKDELRSMEGDPHIRRRRREVQLQLTLQRLRRDVPQADVVVTNPTHVAVAIRYEPEKMAAPKVVAKGADLLALRIRQLASEFRIPIVQRPPLARALYEAVDVGQYVPERLYQAIAEILAYVYELTGRSPLTHRRQRAAAV